MKDEYGNDCILTGYEPDPATRTSTQQTLQFEYKATAKRIGFDPDGIGGWSPVSITKSISCTVTTIQQKIKKIYDCTFYADGCTRHYPRSEEICLIGKTFVAPEPPLQELKQVRADFAKNGNVIWDSLTQAEKDKLLDPNGIELKDVEWSGPNGSSGTFGGGEFTIEDPHEGPCE
jgi:hypothetical protein